MKIRNGFVSNSSSSSFVVQYITKPRCPTCNAKDLIDFLDKIVDDPDTNTTIDFKGNGKGMLKYYADENDSEDYKWEDDECNEKLVKTLKTADPKTIFAEVWIPQEDALVRFILKHSKAIKVITGEEDL